MIDKDETFISQIKFYSGLELLVTVGDWDVDWQKYRGRVETFEIADDKRLIGVELAYMMSYYFI